MTNTSAYTTTYTKMLTLQPTDIYLGLAIIGIFSGIGNAAGQYVFNEIIKPRIHKHIKKINKIKIPRKIEYNNGEIIAK